MERTPEVILSEIKEALRGIVQKVGELENILQSGPSEFMYIMDGFTLDEVDLDIELADDFISEPAAETEPEKDSVLQEFGKEEKGEAGAEADVPQARETEAKVKKAEDKTWAWMVDEPGTPVINILSAISMNDRILFINALFDKDPVLFQNTIRLFNSFASLDQVQEYIAEYFPKWNMGSQTAYRFMMAVRRKIQ